jgi:hypothetical protein
VSTFPIDLDPLALPNPPQPEPREIRAGDTVTWSRYYDDYPPGDGYTLQYVFVSRTANYPINGGMIVAGSQSYDVTVPAATTATWAAGWYRWQAYIFDSATPPNRYTVGEGVVEVLPNLLAATTGFDDREPDEIMLDAVVALLGNKVLTDAQEYRIQERELRKYTFAELLELRSQLEARVRAIRIRRGEIPATQTIGVQFSYAE